MTAIRLKVTEANNRLVVRVDQTTTRPRVLVAGPRGPRGADGTGASTWGGIGGNIEDQTDLEAALQALAPAAALDAHVKDHANPHQVTKAQVGLPNVDNTSDINKPISTDTQTALNDKVSKGDLAVNVKDYGAVGDGVTDDTAAFIAAMAAGKTVIVPKPASAYLIKYFAVPVDTRVVGIGQPQINIQRNGATAISAIRSGCEVDNLYLNSLDADLEWNRVGIENATDVIVRNCRIEGFRHNDLAPNAWGLYITESSGVTVENCEFANNSQSDIAIVDNCSYVTISRCTGTQFILNIEPNTLDHNNHIRVSDCNIYLLMLLEVNFLAHSIDWAHFINCSVANLDYRGANATFENCDIAWFRNIYNWGGKIKNLNSWGYAGNINRDPFFNRVTNTGGDPTQEWTVHYSDAGSVMTKESQLDWGYYLRLNPNGVNTSTMLKKSFPVVANRLYSVRSLFQVYYPSGSGAANCFAYEWYDSGGNIIGTRTVVCVDRKESISNDWSAWDEKEFFMRAPSNAATCMVFVSNTWVGNIGAHRLNIKYVLFSEVYLNSKMVSGNGNTSVDELRVRNAVGPYLVASNLVGGGQWLARTGEIIWSTDPNATGAVGWVCTAPGNPGTWKKFGGFVS